MDRARYLAQAVAVLLCSARTADAQPARTAKLGLSATISGRTVRAEACRAAVCRTSEFELPDGSRAPQVQPLTLAGNRPGALIQAEPTGGVGRFALLVAANDEGEAQELLRGWIDKPNGPQIGERRGKTLLREPGTDGDVFSFGTRYEHVSACGRPVVMNVQRLDAALLEWQAAPNIVLSTAERNAAVRLFAKRSASGYDAKLPRLLSSTVASSAEGMNHRGISDGQLDTSWRERAVGSAEGEIVVMNGSSEVPIEGFQLVVRGTAIERDEQAAPKALFIATDASLFHVTFPEDAMQQPPRTSYEVRLPASEKTDCVAVVLDTAYDERSSTVGISELRAITSLDGEADPSRLVALLAEGGGRAGAAEALLSRGGTSAVQAAIAGFDGLNEGGRERALGVIDAGACSETAAFYVDRAVGAGTPDSWDPEGDPLVAAMRDRLRRCREQARTVLEGVVLSAKRDRERGLAAVALAAIAPAQAVSLLADSLDRGTSEARGYFRRALGAAAGDTRARSALESLFALESFDERPIAVRVELLRALGPRLGEVAGSAGAFAQTSSDRSFRTRFLLLGPAGELAKRGDARAASFLRDRMLHDQSHHVRAGAASAAAGIAALSPELARALDDSRPRVREAALESLARIDGDAATVQRISVLLASDPWTFVRLAAAQALAGQTSSPQRDAALTEALDDSSTAVRRQVIVALAKSTSQASGERVHALADDPQEPSEIRTTAIWALGQLCRRDSVAVLYKLALRAGVPELPYDRPLGMAALQALGAIHPADLAVRLLPLVRDKRVPQQVRSIAREVIASPRRCPN